MSAKYINGVKVTICPPSLATADLHFQTYSNDHRMGRRWETNVGPIDINTPREMTLEEAIGVTALSLREIMNDDEED
jgi:hypothetical protein